MFLVLTGLVRPFWHSRTDSNACKLHEGRVSPWPYLPKCCNGAKGTFLFFSRSDRKVYRLCRSWTVMTKHGRSEQSIDGIVPDVRPIANYTLGTTTKGYRLVGYRLLHQYYRSGREGQFDVLWIYLVSIWCELDTIPLQVGKHTPNADTCSPLPTCENFSWNSTQLLVARWCTSNIYVRA